jgi:4-hydroxy-3-methylbut-2-enyl diphosphate reductase
MNVSAYLVDNASELQAEWLKGKQHVGLTAGASAPEVLVQKVIARLKQLGAASVYELHGISENGIFPPSQGPSAHLRKPLHRVTPHHF